MKSNDLSSYTEIITGIIIPAWSAVRALNSLLVNPKMLIPAWTKSFGPNPVEMESLYQQESGSFTMFSTFLAIL